MTPRRGQAPTPGGCDHHSVKRYVQRRYAGGEVAGASPRPSVVDDFRDKIDELVARSSGKVRADVVHDRLVLLGYDGSERTTRRAVADAKTEFGAGRHRIYRPWITEPVRFTQRWGLVQQNVATLAEPPSQTAVKTDRRQAIQIWQPEQLIQFLNRSQSHWLHPMWVVTTTTGLRRGELTGLIDDNVDLTERRLIVDLQLVPEEQYSDEDLLRQRNPTLPVHKPMPKSSASSRAVDLDEHITSALKDWRAKREEWRLAAGKNWANDLPQKACQIAHPSRPRHGGFVFCWPDGRHLHPDWVTHEFERLCRDADVPAIRLHDVRHTHASLLLAGGEQLKVVQERGGWASSAFLLDSYAHLVQACKGKPPTASQKACSTLTTTPKGAQNDPDPTRDEPSQGFRALVVR